MSGEGGGVILDMNMRTLSSGLATMKLGPKETAVIWSLSQFARVLSYEEISNAIYPIGAEPGDTRGAIRALICNIRKRTVAAGLGRIIETERHNGFYLLGKIEVVGDNPPIVIPAKYRFDLESLLHSHPNKIAADRVLAALVAV